MRKLVGIESEALCGWHFYSMGVGMSGRFTRGVRIHPISIGEVDPTNWIRDWHSTRTPGFAQANLRMLMLSSITEAQNLDA